MQKLRLKSINSDISLISLLIALLIIFMLIIIPISAPILLNSDLLLFNNIKANNEYSINQAKEKLESEINNLKLEQEEKGELLTKEILPKINNNQIDVKSVNAFPIDIICQSYNFNVDENFIVTYKGEAEGTIVTFTSEPEGYTNLTKIKLLIKIENLQGLKSVEYPNGDILNIQEKTTVLGIDYDITQNGLYTFKIVSLDNKEIIKDILIDKIDTVPPKDFVIEKQEENGNVKIIANIEDSEKTDSSTKSGISKIEYCVNGKIHNTNIIEGLSINNIYSLYVIAYDRAGNMKQVGQSEGTLIKNGVPTINWSPYYQNHSTGYLVNNNGYITFTSGTFYKYSNYCTSIKIDLTNYTELTLYGYINMANSSSGHLYVSTDPYTTRAGDDSGGSITGLTKSILLDATLKNYTIDVSDLTGEYYIGVLGSNRIIYLYDVLLK